MRCDKTFGRKIRTGDRKRFDRPSTQARRRASEFKLEALEERTMLSGLPGKGTVPELQPPKSLGSLYTTLWEQAHGTYLHGGNPGQL